MLPIEETILNVGLDNLNLNDKNSYYLYLSNMLNKAVSDITYNDALKQYKVIKITDLEAKCNAQMASGYASTVTGHTYKTLPTDLFNMLAEYVMTVNDSTITTVSFYCEELGANADIPAADFLSDCKAIFQNMKNLNSKLDSDRKTVNTCTKGTNVYNINW
jgi:hypothetical protein